MTTFGIDRLGVEIADVLAALQSRPSSTSLKDVLESKRVDLKEEAGRRSSSGLGPSNPHSEPAAAQLLAEAACMANSDGGGALLVGVADDGTVIGTDLDTEWLRHRLYELSSRQLTCEASALQLLGQRVVVLRCPEAIEPIRVNGRIRWRVDDNCVEVDAASWHDRRVRRIGYDWSGLSSGLPPTSARSSALERARDFLRSSNEDQAEDLADASDLDLLTRLNVMLPDGTMTNAGAIAFVGRDVPALDYLRRDVPSGDSTNRLRQNKRGLIEELYDVVQAIRSSNPIRHVPRGLLVSGQVRQLPERAVREAIVNGCAHRDWHTTDPTVVEHVGAQLAVTSPGGFVGGVNATNIITYPSQTRNRALVDLLVALRIAEREGVGVDRMVRDMLRNGHPAPAIEEIDGPRVRAVLIGDLVDEGWLQLVAQVSPATHHENLNSLLLLRTALDRRWIDAAMAAPVLQRTQLETEAALAALERATVADGPILEDVAGVPPNGERAWRLSEHATTVLNDADRSTGFRRRAVTRQQIAYDYATHRGRISTTELGSIVGARPTNVGQILKALEQEGLLSPGRESRRGAGFFYIPTTRT